MTAVLATLENMRKHYLAASLGDGRYPIAFSPHTYEQFSATPGDYFWLGDDVLTDERGNPCYLAFERTTIEFIHAD